MNTLTALAGSALFFGSFTPVVADEVQGTVNVTYTRLLAVDLSAFPRYPELDDTCKNLYGNLLNTTATVKYNINTKTGIQKVSFAYNNAQVPLSSMGLESKYAFISFGNRAPEFQELGIKYIVFNLDKEFKNSSAFLSFIPPKNENEFKFQCLLTTQCSSPLSFFCNE